MCSTAREAPLVSFSSLPHDIILNVVARVPKRFYPILSCVSKKLRSLVGSSELDKTRFLLGKYDRFYVCCQRYELSYNYFKETVVVSDSQWYTLSNNRGLVLTTLRTPPIPYACALTVDHDIYFFGGWSGMRMWILDTRSGTLREGPNSLVASKFPAVGLVKDKIYVLEEKSKGKYEDIQAQVFDLKTKTWQIAPNPEMEADMKFKPGLCSVVSNSIDGKIYAWGGGFVIAYDSRDGKCDKIIPAEQCFSYDICVIDNVLYMHYPNVGLMWYDSKEKEWRLVHGVNLLGYFGDCFKMADCNGKLVFLWKHSERGQCVVSEVRCTMIALCRSKVAIRGRVEWSGCLSKIPYNYKIRHCLVCPD